MPVQFASGANILRLTRGAPRINATMQTTELDGCKADHSTADANSARKCVAGSTTRGAVDGAQTAGAAHGAVHTTLEAAFPIAPATTAVGSVHVQEGPYHLPA